MPELLIILVAVMLVVALHRHDRKTLGVCLVVNFLMVIALIPILYGHAQDQIEGPARALASLLALGGLLLVRKGDAEKRVPYVLGGLAHTILLIGLAVILAVMPAFRFNWLSMWSLAFLLAAWSLDRVRVLHQAERAWNDDLGRKRWASSGAVIQYGLAVILGLTVTAAIFRQHPGEVSAGWWLLGSAFTLSLGAFVLRSPHWTIIAVIQVLMMHGLYFLQASPMLFGRNHPAMTTMLALATLGLGVFADKGLAYRHERTHRRWIVVFHGLAWMSYALATFMLGSMISWRMEMLGVDPAWFYLPKALLVAAFVLAAGFWNLPKLTGVGMAYALVMAVLAVMVPI